MSNLFSDNGKSLFSNPFTSKPFTSNPFSSNPSTSNPFNSNYSGNYFFAKQQPSQAITNQKIVSQKPQQKKCLKVENNIVQNAKPLKVMSSNSQNEQSKNEQKEREDEQNVNNSKKTEGAFLSQIGRQNKVNQNANILLNSYNQSSVGETVMHSNSYATSNIQQPIKRTCQYQALNKIIQRQSNLVSNYNTKILDNELCNNSNIFTDHLPSPFVNSSANPPSIFFKSSSVNLFANVCNNPLEPNYYVSEQGKLGSQRVRNYDRQKTDINDIQKQMWRQNPPYGISLRMQTAHLHPTQLRLEDYRNIQSDYRKEQSPWHRNCFRQWALNRDIFSYNSRRFELMNVSGEPTFDLRSLSSLRTDPRLNYAKPQSNKNQSNSFPSFSKFTSNPISCFEKPALHQEFTANLNSNQNYILNPFSKQNDKISYNPFSNPFRKQKSDMIFLDQQLPNPFENQVPPFRNSIPLNQSNTDSPLNQYVTHSQKAFNASNVQSGRYINQMKNKCQTYVNKTGKYQQRVERRYYSENASLKAQRSQHCPSYFYYCIERTGDFDVDKLRRLTQLIQKSQESKIPESQQNKIIEESSQKEKPKEDYRSFKPDAYRQKVCQLNDGQYVQFKVRQTWKEDPNQQNILMGRFKATEIVTKFNICKLVEECIVKKYPYINENIQVKLVKLELNATTDQYFIEGQTTLKKINIPQGYYYLPDIFSGFEVKNLKIMNLFGEIEWPGKTNIKNMNFSKGITLNKHGFNIQIPELIFKTFLVTFRNLPQKVQQLVETGQLQNARLTLQKTAQSIDCCQLIDYQLQYGIWKIKFNQRKAQSAFDFNQCFKEDQSEANKQRSNTHGPGIQNYQTPNSYYHK